MIDDENSTGLRFELGRKVSHIFIGFIFIFILFYFGRDVLIDFLIIFLLFGSVIIIAMHRGLRIPVASWMVDRFERKNVRFPGYGAFWYIVGSLLLALFTAGTNQIASAILILALGDAAATIFGLAAGRQRHRHFYNQEKTLEGSVAFFLFSLPAVMLLGWQGVALAALTTVVESLPLPVDDNLSIPLTAAIFFNLYLNIHFTALPLYPM